MMRALGLRREMSRSPALARGMWAAQSGGIRRMALVWVTSLWRVVCQRSNTLRYGEFFRARKMEKASLFLAGCFVDDHGEIFDVRGLDVADGRGADFLDDRVDVALVVEVEVVVGGAGVFPDYL